MSVELTADELKDVRLQLGAGVTEVDLSDEHINAGTMLGAATDYVFERVREDIDLAKLAPNERAVVERFRDETSEDVSVFINTVLKPPQRQQMRRAIVYRTAGLCAPVVVRVVAQSYVGISERQHPPPRWEMLQASLFQRAEDEIDLLRNAFPDDAFLSNQARVAKGFGKITMLLTTGG